MFWVKEGSLLNKVEWLGEEGREPYIGRAKVVCKE